MVELDTISGGEEGVRMEKRDDRLKWKLGAKYHPGYPAAAGAELTRMETLSLDPWREGAASKRGESLNGELGVLVLVLVPVLALVRRCDVNLSGAGMLLSLEALRSDRGGAMTWARSSSTHRKTESPRGRDRVLGPVEMGEGFGTVARRLVSVYECPCRYACEGSRRQPPPASKPPFYAKR